MDDYKKDYFGACVRNTHPGLIIRMRSGFAVLCDYQFIPGWCLLLGYPEPYSTAKALTDLSLEARSHYLLDTTLIGEALIKVCNPLRINYSTLYFYGYKNMQVKADAAIILGAAVYYDQPSPVFLERINHGIWLYQNGHVNKLIFKGGHSKEDILSEAAAARDVALSRGVFSNDIYIDDKSTITQDNLYNAKRIMNANGLSSAILVSDPLHMKRSMLIGEDLGLTLYPSPTPTTRYTSFKEKFFFCLGKYFFMWDMKFIHYLLKNKTGENTQSW